MNVSIPDTLRAFVDEQIAKGRFGTTSEYVRDLIRRDQDREHLRGLLLEGAASGDPQAADEAFFDGLRDRAHRGA